MRSEQLAEHPHRPPTPDRNEPPTTVDTAHAAPPRRIRNPTVRLAAQGLSNSLARELRE
jgi:hypothetical protein